MHRSPKHPTSYVHPSYIRFLTTIADHTSQSQILKGGKKSETESRVEKAVNVINIWICQLHLVVQSIFIQKKCVFAQNSSSSGMSVRSFPMKNRKNVWLVTYHFATTAGLVPDVNDTDCWAQNGSTHGRENLLQFWRWGMWNIFILDVLYRTCYVHLNDV